MANGAGDIDQYIMELILVTVIQMYMLHWSQLIII